MMVTSTRLDEVYAEKKRYSQQLRTVGRCAPSYLEMIMNEKEITVRVFYDEDDLERTYIIPAFYEGLFLVVEETPI